MLTGFVIYKQTANLRRLVHDAVDADIEGYVNIYTGMKLNIQPARPEYEAMIGDGSMGRIFKAYTTFSGCQIGMEIITSGTTTISGMKYAIIGNELWNGPLGRHWELTLRLNIK